MIEILCDADDKSINIAQKFEEYGRYIDAHRKCVGIASACLTSFLLEKLNIDAKIFNELILNHDMSKYHPLEFIPYRGYFYPVDEMEKLQYKEAFEEAWQHHIAANPHHPEHYTTDKVPYEMPDIYLAEMICDLWGMSIKLQTNTPLEYINRENEMKYIMNPKSYEKLIKLLTEIDELQLMKNVYPATVM